MNEDLNRLIHLDNEFGDIEFKMEVISNNSVFVTHSGIGINKFKIIPETLFNNIGLARLKELKRYAYFKYFTEKRINTEPNALFIHHVWSNGYHHWICDCLIKLNQIKAENYVLYIPFEYPSFVFESLTLYPFKKIFEFLKRRD